MRLRFTILALATTSLLVSGCSDAPPADESESSDSSSTGGDGDGDEDLIDDNDGVNTVFTTSGLWSGELGGLVGADAKCQEMADLAGRTGTYRAWLSDSSTTAADRVPHSSAPYARTDGAVLAASWDDFVDGILMLPIELDELGNNAGSGHAWTATAADGSLIEPHCDDWSSSEQGSAGRVGSPEYTDPEWSSHGQADCDEMRHLYCVEVAAPGGGDGDGETTGDGDGDGDGDAGPRLRFLAGDLTQPPLDVYVDNDLTPSVAGLTFQAGTDYFTVSPGAHVLKLVTAGGPVDGAALSFPLDVGSGTRHSVVTHVGFPGIFTAPDETTGIDPAMIRIRMTHIAQDYGQLDFYAYGDNQDALVTNIGFGQSQQAELPAGTIALGIDLDNDMMYEAVYTLPDPGAGNFMGVYVLNEDGGAPLFLLAHLPDGTTTRLDKCGDGVLTDAEACDGSELDGLTCADIQDFNGGSLGCLPGCVGLDISGCGYCGGPANIPDNDGLGVSVDIMVPGALSIGDLDLSVEISHTDLADLSASVTKGATTVELFSGITEVNMNACNGSNMSATLDDEALASIQSQACDEQQLPAVEGSYMPLGTLSDFDGVEAMGSWSVQVIDDAPNQVGTLDEVCLLPAAQ